MDIRHRTSRHRPAPPRPAPSANPPHPGCPRLSRRLLPLLLLLPLASPSPASAQSNRTISGVVVDTGTGGPVADAVISLRGTGLGAVTDSAGRFEVAGVPVGDHVLVLSHVAWGEQTEPLAITASGPLDFRILVSSRAIVLEPLEVEVAAGAVQAERSSGTATNIIDRTALEASPPGGQGLLDVLRGRIPSLRVMGSCVEYRVQQHGVFQDPDNPELLITVPCRDITVYVNGVPNPQGSALLEQLSPQDVERIQVLSPSEASLQYMSGSRGVILVELRRGLGRETPYRIHRNGFGWDEPRRYPWFRVLGVSALGNAAVVGAVTRTLLHCGEEDTFGGAPRCHGIAGMTAAVLTGAVGPLFTRWAGRTPASEGRTYPALLATAATASLGYLLYVDGENTESDGSRLAGQVVLGVGIPVVLTLSNRIFRALR